MDTFDPQVRIQPIGAADQGMVSKKIRDKQSQEQGPGYQPPKKGASTQPPKEEDEESQAADHAIDIIV